MAWKVSPDPANDNGDFHPIFTKGINYVETYKASDDHYNKIEIHDTDPAAAELLAERIVKFLEDGRVAGQNISNPITMDDALKFLGAVAKYFENRTTAGEDSNHWANVYNADNCRRIADLLKTR